MEGSSAQSKLPTGSARMSVGLGLGMERPWWILSPTLATNNSHTKERIGYLYCLE